MNMPDDVGEARKALAAGDYARARAHLAVARQEGADQSVLSALRQEIDDAEGAVTKNSSKHLLWALAVAAIAYVVLSLQSPPNWGMPLWIGLAFVVVPACVGLLAGMSLPPHSDSGDRFKRAMWLAMVAMAIYTAVGLILSGRKIGSHTELTQIFLLGLLVVVAFGLIAGLVAGFATRLVGGKSK